MGVRCSGGGLHCQIQATVRGTPHASKKHCIEESEEKLSIIDLSNPPQEHKEHVPAFQLTLFSLCQFNTVQH